MKNFLTLLFALIFSLQMPVYGKSTIDSRMKGLEHRAFTVAIYLKMDKQLDVSDPADQATINQRRSDIQRVLVQWHKAHYISANTGTSFFDKFTGQNAFCFNNGVPDFAYSFGSAFPKHGGSNSEAQTFVAVAFNIIGGPCADGFASIASAGDAEFEFWTKQKTTAPSAATYPDFQTTGRPYADDLGDTLSRQTPFTQAELAGIDLSWVKKVDLTPHYLDEQSVDIASCSAGDDFLSDNNISATSGVTVETADLKCIDESGTKKMQLDGTSSGGIAAGFSRGFQLSDFTVSKVNALSNHTEFQPNFTTMHSFEVHPEPGLVLEFGPKALYQQRWTFFNDSGTTKLKKESVDSFGPVQQVFLDSADVNYHDAHATATAKTLSTVERTSNIATAETTAAHGLSVGDYVNIDADDNAYDRSPAVVLSAADSTHFTYGNVGADEGNKADAGSATQREPYIHALNNNVNGVGFGRLNKDITWNRGFSLYLSRRKDALQSGIGGFLGKIGFGIARNTVFPLAAVSNRATFCVNMINTSANALTTGKLKFTEMYSAIGFNVFRLQAEKKLFHYAREM